MFVSLATLAASGNATDVFGGVIYGSCPDSVFQSVAALRCIDFAGLTCLPSCPVDGWDSLNEIAIQITQVICEKPKFGSLLEQKRQSAEIKFEEKNAAIARVMAIRAQHLRQLGSLSKFGTTRNGHTRGKGGDFPRSAKPQRKPHSADVVPSGPESTKSDSARGQAGGFLTYGEAELREASMTCDSHF